MKTEPEDGCIFCGAYSYDSDDFEVLRIKKTDHSIMMLNRYPYTNGHIMVAPRRHLDNMADLTAEEKADIRQKAKDKIK